MDRTFNSRPEGQEGEARLRNVNPDPSKLNPENEREAQHTREKIKQNIREKSRNSEEEHSGSHED